MLVYFNLSKKMASMQPFVFKTRLADWLAS